MKKISILLAFMMLCSGMGGLKMVSAEGVQTSNTVYYADLEDTSATYFDATINPLTSKIDDEHGKSYSIFKLQTGGDFQKKFKDKAITSGKAIFSYDFYFEGQNTQFTDILRFNAGNQWNGDTPYIISVGRNSNAAQGLIIGFTDAEGSWVHMPNCPSYEFNKWIHMDFVVDLDKNSAGDTTKSHIKMYMNGVEKMTRDIPHKLRSLHGFQYTVENKGEFYVEGSGTHYVDNFKVTTNNGANVEIAKEYSDGYTDILFGEAIANLDTVTAADISMVVNEEDLAVSAVKHIDYNKLRLYHDGKLSAKTNYSIEIGKNLVSILGKTLSSNTIANEYISLNKGKMPVEYRADSDFEDETAFDWTKNFINSTLDNEHGKSYSIVKYQGGGEWKKKFLEEKITSGKATFSYDMYYEGQNTQFTDILRFDFGNQWNADTQYIISVGRHSNYAQGTIIGFTNAEGSWTHLPNCPTYEFDKWIHMDFVVDLDKDSTGDTTKSHIKMYMDGIEKMTRDIPHKVRSFHGFYYAIENAGTNYVEGNGTHYIDNMRVVVNTGNNFKAGVKFKKGASHVIFTESLTNPELLTTNNVTLTKNGKPVSVHAVKVVNNSEIRIEHDNWISDEDVYEITLPNGLTSILGKTIDSDVITNRITVTSIKTKDSKDNETEIGATLPVDTKEISIALDGAVEKTVLDNVFSLVSDGKSAVYTTSYDEQTNIYTISLPKYLKPNQEYILSIAIGAGIIPIERRFETGNGVVAVTKIAFYQGDTEITNLSSVSGEITLCATVVNTTGKDKTYSLSYGTYVGSLMKDMDFVEGTIDADEVNTTKEFKINIAKETGMVVKGYAWDGIATMNPYIDTWAELK